VCKSQIAYKYDRVTWYQNKKWYRKNFVKMEEPKTEVQEAPTSTATQAPTVQDPENNVNSGEGAGAQRQENQAPENVSGAGATATPTPASTATAVTPTPTTTASSAAPTTTASTTTGYSLSDQQFCVKN
jgi:hypothetical protein